MADVCPFVSFEGFCNLYWCFLLGEVFSFIFGWERPHLTFYFPTVAGHSKKASALLHLAPNF